MAQYKTAVSYVSEDGNYGTGGLITFDYDELTEAQWALLDDLTDSDKLRFVAAVLEGKPTDEWED
jgi:hypothetical protein